MAERSNIEWCDATFNPWIGCTKISPACDHCYAERDFDLRLHVVQWGAGQARKRTGDDNWKKPGKWNAKPFFQCEDCGHRSEGEKWREVGPNMGLTDSGYACPRCNSRSMNEARRRVFCASLADVFDNEVPVQWRRDLFDLIAATPNLDWLLLTKRIGNVRSLYGGAYLDSARPLPPNVWLGATICNQDEADRDIPKLLDVPAAVRFVSIEPMLGPVDLTDIVVRHGGGTEDHFSALYDADDDEADTASYIDWVICGGESGPHARPMHPQWARSLRDQCAAARVAFLHKQNGEWVEKQQADMIGDFSDVLRGSDGSKVITRHGAIFYRVGKKAAGRLLDGVEYNGFPEVRE